MQVKRAGHTLVYVPNSSHFYIYAIGGRTNDKTRTKLCERFDSSVKTWEKVSNLNYARSRCAATLYNNNSIYVFYGTNSFGKSVSTIEKLDLNKNEWSIIDVCNHLPGYDITYGNCV